MSVCLSDLRVTGFKKSLSSAVLAKIEYLGPYATIVDFSVTFKNVASGEDIPPRTDGQANYGVTIHLSDSWVCEDLPTLAGPPFNGVFNNEADVSKLSQGSTH